MADDITNTIDSGEEITTTIISDVGQAVTVDTGHDISVTVDGIDIAARVDSGQDIIVTFSNPIQGSAGTSGTSGSSSTSGTSGLSGSSGTSGISGTSGTSGTSGLSGSSGTSGTGFGADSVTVDATAFHGMFSTSDTTVQLALGTLDTAFENLGTSRLVVTDLTGSLIDGSNSDAEVSDTVAAKHTRLHAIDSTLDHTSTGTAGYMLKADTNGLPTTATNTDVEVADAVAKRHDPATGSVERYWQILPTETVTVPDRVQYECADNLDLRGTLVLQAGSELLLSNPVIPDEQTTFTMIEYANLASFPAAGTDFTIYIAMDTGVSYRWSGTQYASLNPTLALGETSVTAYRGDRGAVAYTHSQIMSGNPHGLSPGDLGLDNVNNTSDAFKPISASQQAALDLKVPLTRTVNGHQLSTNVTVTKSDIGLSNVDNTADASKPLTSLQINTFIMRALATGSFGFLVSSGVGMWTYKTLAETQTLLDIDLKAPINLPVFTGYITTPAVVGNTTGCLLYSGGLGKDALIAYGDNGAAYTIRMYVNSGGYMGLSHYGAGTATFDANGLITSSSDERLKNIQATFSPGLPSILQINPIIYKWKPESRFETEHEYAGFSAQNVRAAIGELAVGQDEQGMLSLQDRAIMAALVNAVKELSAEVEILKKRIAHE